jgi:hypothetical protein
MWQFIVDKSPIIFIMVMVLIAIIFLTLFLYKPPVTCQYCGEKMSARKFELHFCGEKYAAYSRAAAKKHEGKLVSVRHLVPGKGWV